MWRSRVRSIMASGLLAALALAVGCQEYGFEELPSSVIKEKRWETTLVISAAVDILMVIDNSGSMVGEQLSLGASFGAFTQELEDFFGDNYRIAVITTGMESEYCGPCTDTVKSSCMNETGESGRFQSWLGHNDGTVSSPDFSFIKPGDADYPPECGEIISANNKHCFYDPATERGIGLVGINGCGYEKGFEPILRALKELQPNFLREDATLAIIVVSDEEDCGFVGETTEDPQVGGNVCYYAAKGVDPEGNTNDPTGKVYQLSSIEKTYNDLLALKGNREGFVKFAAIVGVTDIANPGTTEIKYYQDNNDRWRVEAACETPGCKAACNPADPPAKYQRCLEYCEAKPGTRYIRMAQRFGLEEGQNGFLDTICQADFSDTMRRVGNFVGCPKVFTLTEPILHPDLANILINGEEVPRYSCGFDEIRLVECSGPEDTSCPDGASCVPTWEYHAPTGDGGGTITFAPHYDPCEFFEPGESVHIELVYATP